MWIRLLHHPSSLSFPPRSSLRRLLLLLFLLLLRFIPFSSFEIMQIQHPRYRFLVPLGRKANFCANQADQPSKINVGTPFQGGRSRSTLPPEMCLSASFDSREQTRLLINCCLVFTRRKDGAFLFPLQAREN